MKKNAFTLVEVLGVIILLGLVSAITVPVVNTTLEESKKKILNKQINTIIESTKNWGIKNIDKLPEKHNGSILIKIDTLKQSGFLDNKKIINPVNKKEMNACVEIKYSDSFNQYEYIYSENCEISSRIITSDNNCIKNSNEICENGTLVSVKVNNTITNNFYIIDDTGEELTLIMDKNIGTQVAWMNKENYLSTGGTEIDYGADGNNAKGPLTALNKLEADTSGWINIATRTYELSDDGGENKYFDITKNNVRSRMLTYTEASNLGCTTNSLSCPNYLYINTSNSNTVENPYGYWLSSASASDSASALYINFGGSIGSISVSNTSDYGVRPVIELVKPIIY